VAANYVTILEGIGLRFTPYDQLAAPLLCKDEVLLLIVILFACYNLSRKLPRLPQDFIFKVYFSFKQLLGDLKLFLSQ